MRKLDSRNITPPSLLTSRKIGFNSGFTIIEVALVLAIAGLIFLVVFLALPALQNSQADNARRQAVGQMVSAAESFETDNGGIYGPNFGLSTYSPYVGKLPNSISFQIIGRTGTSLPTTSKADVMWDAKCGTDTSSAATMSTLFNTNNGSTQTQSGQPVNLSTSIAIAIQLSSGGYYCQDV